MSLTASDLKDYLESELGVDTSGIEDGDALFSSGVIDSFALVSLIVFIEGKCGFRVQPMEVNLDNMDSIERILAFVQSKTS